MQCLLRGLKSLDQNLDARVIFPAEISESDGSFLPNNWIGIIEFDHELVKIWPLIAIHAVTSLTAARHQRVIICYYDITGDTEWISPEKQIEKLKRQPFNTEVGKRHCSMTN